VTLHDNLTYFNICLCAALVDLLSLSPAPWTAYFLLGQMDSQWTYKIVRLLW